MAGATVTFGTAAATNVVVVSATQITANTPFHAAGTVTVTVTNPDGTDATRHKVSVTLQLRPLSPAFNRIGPATGGTAVTIAGANFQPGAMVTFGGILATNVAVVNSGQITASTPAQVAGVVAVTITNPDGHSSTFPNAFTYTIVPSVTSIVPNSGPLRAQHQ